MTREEVIKHVAEWYGIPPAEDEDGNYIYDEDGNPVYDLDDYDWTSGCRFYATGKWMCAKDTLKCVMSILHID